MLLLNGQKVQSFDFSGGEIQVKLPEKIEPERVVLTWKPRDAHSIVKLMLTVNALKHAGISDIDLEVMYLPYGRQDRVCSSGEAFSLEVITKILNNLGVTTIRFHDNHNHELVDQLMDDTWVFHTEVFEVFQRYKLFDNFDIHNLILCAPDEGAYERVMKLNDTNEHLGNVIAFDKERDLETGVIKSIRWNTYNRDTEGWDVLVVDDICDGGQTFLEVANELKNQGANKLYLYVTHGIFSKGLAPLLEYYKHIYCHHVLHDSLYQSNEFLTILREFPNVS